MSDFNLENNHTIIREATKNQPRSINPGGGFIIGVGIFAVILWNFISNWENQTTPAKYLLAFYDYTVIEPLRLIPRFYEYAHHANFTPYNNLNLVLSILVICAYLFVFIPFIIKLLIKVLSVIKLDKYKWQIFFLPGILYVLYFIIHWLFR